MKKSEIPQDEGPLKGWTREVCYAKNEDGKYERGLSAGWSVKNDALDSAWEEVNKSVEEALKQVRAGKMSPIFYFMELKLMDVAVLAHYTGFWKWTVKRHFNPFRFKKLSDKVLQKYADVFEVSVEQLKNFK
ncbi:hypothetical protein H9Y05_01735 [Crocinitomicaceae bacterium CZZ-1]|uniref:HTH cro/C1-type domain-containing protein n=1 Tax=Taishania pollutisoli TaxID=2766479 RepID=A0A8J6TSF0_9FLAO|nr:hypothetical protein [Taishania pollutisoli]MBC9811184.1 hypothetical protein [Taishania pollutisoli]MBX2947899.1 hypothetical protein [Crocinitomicaceae bacterium]NGF74969.1 hypothetical protein [Fluviicola sp. SGL-29]